MPVIHLHRSLQLHEGKCIKLKLDTPANVYLLDNANYHLFMQDRPYTFHGTQVNSSPFLMNPPYPGAWELVVFSNTPGETLTVDVSIVDK
jgi:hypothetical protein